MIIINMFMIMIPYLYLVIFLKRNKIEDISFIKYKIKIKSIIYWKSLKLNFTIEILYKL